MALPSPMVRNRVRKQRLLWFTVAMDLEIPGREDPGL
jgi:hypothetical protein